MLWYLLIVLLQHLVYGAELISSNRFAMAIHMILLLHLGFVHKVDGVAFAESLTNNSI
jgi:hypothetical protein